MARACKSADEYDAFTGWRRYYRWKPGQLKRVKRRAAKRERRQARAVVAAEVRDAEGR